jgi:hypothetical protein
MLVGRDEANTGRETTRELGAQRVARRLEGEVRSGGNPKPGSLVLEEDARSERVARTIQTR